MRKKYPIFYCLFVLFFVACENGSEVIEITPAIINKYDPGKSSSVDEILPVRGIIDQTFIINGNFPGELSDMKVYFGSKRAVLTATDGISITGLVPKQPEGLNQISVVLGTDSLVPASMLFKYKQSRSVKTISGKLGTDKWMTDAQYAGAALDAVTYGEVDFAVALKGQRLDNIFMIKAGWNPTYLFLLSQDDNKIQKLGTPDALCHPAVNTARDAFYVTQFWNKDRTIFYYSKANSWVYATTGIKIKQSELPGAKVSSMTFGETDNLVYMMDSEGRIAEANLQAKTYKVYTSAVKKPGGLTANYGGEIKGALPTSFGDWTDSFLTYSKYHKCFFASFSNQHTVYKLVKNADNSWTSTVYAGGNGKSITMGHRLVDAQLNRPFGITVNAEGEIFIACKGDNSWDQSGHVIVKIVGDVVELVAGKPTQKDPLSNGDPLEATFTSPRTLSIDSDGNYIIAAGEDRAVRKLSIE